MKRSAIARKTPLRAMSKKHAERLREVRKELRPARKPMRKSRPKSTPARRAAKGMPCLMNVAGVCNYNSETTVLAHFRWLGDCGTGIKPRDEQGAHACSECNRWTDSPTPKERDETYDRDRNFYAARALVRMRLLDALDAF